MTLTSRSVLACQARSPSGFCSANQSQHGTLQESHCRKPYYWSSGCNWPISKDVLFRHVFHQCPTSSPYYKYTCYDVLCGKVSFDTSHNHCLGQYLVAGYLNACMGWSQGFLSTSDCTTLGNEWLQTGLYHPNAHVTWNCSQIVQYFENTQT